jgi:methylenetetrahydrofolate--tRNA-(uracil-5-)-methyltransferase
MTTMTQHKVRVIGGGLAGCEAAYQLAEAGVHVTLHEQKPEKRTAAQTSDRLAELVCSNSFRSSNVDNAVGLIKEEMRHLGSFLMACAEVARVPAGDALAVDRVVFADTVEGRLRQHKNITIAAGEVTAIPDDDVPTIVATGPLTSDALAADIARLCGQERLAFYDAIAPIVDAESIILDDEDPERGAFFKSRWNKGDSADYLNCPLDRDEYARFYEALRAADTASAHEFEDLHYFDGCLPLEVMAERGVDTLRFGPMKPVGLFHPVTNKRAHAVLQLRKEDIHGSSYNLVGCQTRMKQPAQREVFSLVPALREVKFLRYGAIHRNTYVDSPAVLDERGALKSKRNVWFAGQITGVEGYVESTASGLTTALVVADALRGLDLDIPPEFSALGGLWRHCRGVMRADTKARFSPSNVIWPMMPPLPTEVLRPVSVDGKKGKKPAKGDRKHLLSERALAALDTWVSTRRAAGRYVGAPPR